MMGLLEQLGPWNWMVLAAVFLGLEIVVPGIYFMWFGVAAALTGLAAFAADLAWTWQLVLFGAFSLAAVFAANRWLKRHPLESDRPFLNRRAERHVGHSFVLVDAIVDGRGRIKIDDSIWQVEGPDQPKGGRVLVTAARGTVLEVRPAEPAAA